MKTTISFSGTALITAYSFPHKLGYNPNYVQVTPLSLDAGGNDNNGIPGGAYWVSHDAINITINYYSQPTPGVANLVFSVEALVITSFDGNGNPLCGQNNKC